MKKEEIPIDFYFPPEATYHAAIRAKELLYSSKDSCELLPYFTHLEICFVNGINQHSLFNLPKIFNLFINYANLLYQKCGRKEKLTADVLIVGECRRTNEIQTMKRLITSLARQKKSMIYIVSRSTLEYKIIHEFVKNENIKKITIFDSYPRNILEKVFVYSLSLHRVITIQQMINALLPDNIIIKSNPLKRIITPAIAQTVWHKYRDCLQFNELFIRNHWTPFSATIAIDIIHSGKKITTSQHGIASTPYWAPIIATHCLCFGNPSVETLSKIDRDMAIKTMNLQYCNKFIPVGSLFDDISILPSNFGKKTLLVIDQNQSWAIKYYGIRESILKLQQIVGEILNENIGFKKVIIRLHPDNKKPQFWINLVKKYPNILEISKPNENSLTFDLSRSSFSLGLFSGALVTSAARGIPPLFIWQPGWFYTPDLSCFLNGNFFNPDQIFTVLKKYLHHSDDYEGFRRKSIDTSAQYYHNHEMYDFHE